MAQCKSELNHFTFCLTRSCSKSVLSMAAFLFLSCSASIPTTIISWDLHLLCQNNTWHPTLNPSQLAWLPLFSLLRNFYSRMQNNLLVKYHNLWFSISFPAFLLELQADRGGIYAPWCPKRTKQRADFLLLLRSAQANFLFKTLNGSTLDSRLTWIETSKKQSLVIFSSA